MDGVEFCGTIGVRDCAVFKPQIGDTVIVFLQPFENARLGFHKDTLPSVLENIPADGVAGDSVVCADLDELEDGPAMVHKVSDTEVEQINCAYALISFRVRLPDFVAGRLCDTLDELAEGHGGRLFSFVVSDLHERIASTAS
jgi:hypothetical protein